MVSDRTDTDAEPDSRADCGGASGSDFDADLDPGSDSDEDRTGAEDEDEDEDEYRNGSADEDEDKDRNETADADSLESDANSLSIPSVDTENAGSGLWADLKADSGVDSVDVPEIANDVAEPVAPVGGSDIDLEDVPSDLLKTFWALVLVINAAVLAIAVGALLLVFEGSTDQGVALLLGGCVLVGFAVRRYRRYQAAADESGAESRSGSDANSDSSSDSDSNPDCNADSEMMSDSGTEAESGPKDDSEPANSSNTESPRSGETSSNEVAEQRSPDDADPS